MSSTQSIRLKVPRQDLDSFDLFVTDEQAARQWVDALPRANLGQTTRQLYRAVSELNRVRLLPAKRLKILDILRTPIYQVTRGLAKHYLNQPIVLPEQPRKVAQLAHALHRQLATGYTIVATHSAALGRRAGHIRPDTLIAPALHRAITDHTLNIVRHCQLYQSVEDGVWHSLHHFYRLARQHKLPTRQVEDTECGSGTVEEAYLRALLIGCSKPNQLRQEDFLRLFSPLTHWAGQCRLQDGDDALFSIDLDADRPPVYRELLAQAPGDSHLGLETRMLAQHLRKLLDSHTGDALTVAGTQQTLSRDLLGHLALAWSKLSQRCFIRLEADDSLDLAIGLSATHHFVSGEISLEALVEERGAKTYTLYKENPFLKARGQVMRQKDVWDSPYETNVGQTSVAIETVDLHIRSNAEAGDPEERGKYRSHAADIVNASAHGYCVSLSEGAEAPVKPGEIVGVRESRSHNWSVATIRWVRQDEHGPQIGLELISPGAAPYGARIVRKTGGPGEYVRVLVLPEVPAIRQPVSLITPKVPFKTGMKVILNQRGKEVSVHLDRKMNDSGAYNRFQFHRLAQSGGKPTETDKESPDDFESLWGSL